MILYMAGAEQPRHLAKLIKAKYPHALFVVWEKYESDYTIPRAFRKVFLDSGAFSARTRDIEINIDKYIEFITRNQKQITSYACLDVIGDYKGTLRNQRYMESKGLKPVWVFHGGKEPFELLNEMKSEYEYIALGGISGVIKSKIRQKRYLDKCFSIIGRKKVHGFGVTSIDLLKTYPFYSCDSTSWLEGEKRGKLYRFSPRKMLAYSSRDRDDMLRLRDPELVDIENKQYTNRSIYNACEFLKLEKFITELWKKRGVVWNGRSRQNHK